MKIVQINGAFKELSFRLMYSKSRHPNMKKIFISIFLCLLPIVGFSQSTEQINPKDPAYNVELNSLLQTNAANINVTTNNVTTLQGYFSSGILLASHGGTGQDSSAW